MDVQHRGVFVLLGWLCVRFTGAISIHNISDQNRPKKIDPHNLLWGDSNVHVVTVDTRTDGMHRMEGPWGWDTHVLNLGAGKAWVDLRTKVHILQDWLLSKPIGPNETVVFVDGDAMYGGCSLEEFKKRLKRILKVTNSTVVFGVEAQCNDYSGDCYTDYPTKYYNTVLKEFSCTKEQMQTCTDDLDRKVGRCDAEISPRKCNSHHELKFINSGFFAGHAVKVLHLLRQWLQAMNSTLPNGSKVKLNDNPSDQASATLMLEQHPNSVTLDYATMLISNLYGLDLNKKLYSYKSESKVWFNNVIKENVCFFHPNGNLSALAYFTHEYKAPKAMVNGRES